MLLILQTIYLGIFLANVWYIELVNRSNHFCHLKYCSEMPFMLTESVCLRSEVQSSSNLLFAAQQQIP